MANLVFMDGFDHRADCVDGQKWQNGGANISATYSRNTAPVGKGFSIGNVTSQQAGPQYQLPGWAYKPVMTFGFACQNRNTNPGGFWVWTYDNHTSSGASVIETLADGSVRVKDVTSVYAVSPANRVAFRGAFQYWEIQITLNTWQGNGTPNRDGRMVVYIDGNLAVDSGATLQTSNNRLVDGLPNPGFTAFSIQAYPEAWIDDVYVTVGTDGQTFPGPSGESLPTINARMGNLRVYTLPPSADAAPLDFIPSTGLTHFNLVNDFAGNMDMSPYVQAQQVGNTEMFFVDASIIPDGATILGAQTVILCQKTTVNNAGFKMRIFSNSVERLSADGAVPNTIPHYFTEAFVKDPGTGNAWTKSALGAARFGAVLQAS